mmetsp:Transcript_16762/g.48994  ORF Transcript_16762/g.48994 Transcript_16762/m.48994 type:complete len:529 (+) Transcript_16762:135-1721(+)
MQYHAKAALVHLELRSGMPACTSKDARHLGCSERLGGGHLMHDQVCSARALSRSCRRVPCPLRPLGAAHGAGGTPGRHGLPEGVARHAHLLLRLVGRRLDGAWRAVAGFVMLDEVELGLGLEQQAQEPAGGLRVLGEGAGPGAPLGEHPPEEALQPAADLKVGIHDLFRVPAVAEEQVLEGELVELVGLHALRPTEGEAVVFERARGMRLAGEPEPFPEGRVEEVFCVLKHGEAGEGQHLHAREEVEDNHGHQVGYDVCQRQPGPDGRELEACAHGTHDPKQLRRSAWCRRWVEEEEGVDGAPPGDKVHVLQVRDAIVEGNTNGRERPRRQGGRQQERQRCKCLDGHGEEGEGRQQQPRPQVGEDLGLVRERRGHPKGKVCPFPAEQQRLEDRGLQRGAVPPGPPRPNRRCYLGDAGAAVCRGDHQLHEPGGQGARARLQHLRVVTAGRGAVRRGERQEYERGRHQDRDVGAHVCLAVELREVEVVEDKGKAKDGRLPRSRHLRKVWQDQAGHKEHSACCHAPDAELG